MVLYIGDRKDEEFVGEIARNITDQMQIVTEIHTMQGAVNAIYQTNSTYVIINVLSMTDSPEEIVKTLKYIQGSVSHELVVIARGMPTEDPFIQSLYFAGIKNIILSTWMPTVISQCIKYITGAYQDTALMEPETTYVEEENYELGQSMTQKLDLTQVFENDPDILKQLQEDPTSNDIPYKGTEKLSAEEYSSMGMDVLKQVQEYEQQEPLQEEQSTRLYMNETNADDTEKMDIPIMPINQPKMQNIPYQEQYQYNPVQFNNPPLEPKQEQQPRDKQVVEKQVNKKPKKSKKAFLLSASLCVILLLSISVPVAYTMHQKTIETKKQKELFGMATTESATNNPEEETKPSDTPEPQIVVGVDEQSTMVPEEKVTSSPSEKATITLTPIKGEGDNTPKPSKNPKPKPTSTEAQSPTMEPTAEPTKEPIPNPTVRPTKTPKPMKTPKSTKAPVHIKELIVPSSIQMKKGTSTDVETSYSPSNATDTISWSSSNTSIATVSGGIIYAKKVGTVTITAKTSNGITKRIHLVIFDE